MAHLLGIGIATLDIVNTVDGFPHEDAEVRAVAHTQRRGGNVANTLVVLSQLGHTCAFAGTLADDTGGAVIHADLTRHRIDTTSARTIPDSVAPTSYVTLNARNGSRTIVHFRHLPEYTAEDFAGLDLAPYAWLHFEGRNIDDCVRMLEHTCSRRPDVPVSIEIEKPRDGIAQLLRFGTVVFFSRPYANTGGYDDAISFLLAQRAHATAPLLVCTWGSDGAYAVNAKGLLFHAPAHRPSHVVDTLGAGDTFNAGFIDAQLRGLAPDAALEFATRLAGRKCGQYGFDGLGHTGSALL